MSSTSNDNSISPLASYNGPCIDTIIKELTNPEQTLYSYSYEAKSDILTLALSKDGSIAFAGCKDSSIIVYNLKTRIQEENLFGHNQSIINLKISADGEYLISASSDGTIICWDVNTRLKINYIDISPLIPETIILTDPLRMIFIGNNGNNILGWDPLNGKSFIELKGHSDSVLSLSISYNNQYLASASKDCSVKIWNLHERNEKFTLKGHESWVTCIVSGKKTDITISGSEDKTIRIWNCINGKEEAVLKGHAGEIYVLSLNSNDTMLISGSQDRTAKVWDLKSKTVLYNYTGHSMYATCCGFVLDDAYAYSASYQDIALHNLSSFKLEIILVGHTNYVFAVSYNHLTKSLISVSLDKTLKIWNINDSIVRATLKGHTSYVSCIDISNDSKYIVSGSWDNNLIIWNIKTKTIKNVLKGHTYYVSCVGISKDVKKIISASWDCTLRIWDFESGTNLHILSGHEKAIFLLKLTSDFRYAITSSSDYKIKCWSLRKCKEKFSVSHTQIALQISLTLDEKYIVSNSLDGYAHIINIKAKKPEHTIELDKQIFRHALSYDNSLLCLAPNSYELELYNTFNLKKLGTITYSEKPIYKILMNKNQTYLVGYSNTNYIYVWDINTKVEYCSFDCGSELKSMIFAPDDNFIISGCKDGSLKIWNITEKSLEVNILSHTADVECLELTKCSRYLISGSRDFSIKIWKFRDLYKVITHGDAEMDISCLDLSMSSEISSLKNSSDSAKYKTLSMRKMYPALLFNGFCQRLTKKLQPEFHDCFIFLPGTINLLHIYSHLGLYSQLSTALSLNCTIRKDAFGNSPLYYAIKKDSPKCIDTILEHIISLSHDESKYNTYIRYNYALRDDLINIIQLPSLVVSSYLESIFTVCKCKDLPNSLKTFSPPIFITTSHTKIYLSTFEKTIKPTKNHIRESSVEFRTTPIEFNMTNGSKDLHNFFIALRNSENQKIFSTKIIKTIIDNKFQENKNIILITTWVMWIMLGVMICCITEYKKTKWINAMFLGINIMLICREVLESIHEGILSYFLYWENYLDIISIIISISWIFLNWLDYDLQLLTWVMIGLNFIKGLTGFRAFDNTRYYVRLLVRAINDSYSFLFIFVYTTLAFGSLNSVTSSSTLFSMLWKVPYELSLGQFASPEDFSIEYMYFLLASSVNIIMMLNLLISILGDSFDRFQIEAEEIDYIEKLKLLMDHQCFYIILKKKEQKGYLQLCDLDGHAGSLEKWNGKIKEIEMKIDYNGRMMEKRLKSIESVQERTMKMCEAIERRMQRIEEKIGTDWKD
ncbi:hypothetical protein SteCoe_16891 [Stentor coeruleus]|uniref:Uncharacterized protein n=1 Tax=Stentor coeruleus TaxID=5963 RepID=A0A1R2C080_9CILI|nr:hypothetical protein SteCoe_16891 [Stentor coeruleus]